MQIQANVYTSKYKNDFIHDFINQPLIAFCLDFSSSSSGVYLLAAADSNLSSKSNWPPNYRKSNQIKLVLTTWIQVNGQISWEDIPTLNPCIKILRFRLYSVKPFFHFKRTVPKRIKNVFKFQNFVNVYWLVLP
jgi:hypothetical protein